MGKKIYGIDIENEVTPVMVRDAIIECFQQAHCLDAGIESTDKDVIQGYCRSIVEKAFQEAGGDFNQPTKASILNCLNKLVDFSKNFRNPLIIQKHYNEIVQLVNKLKD